jgi:hypothetical protein
MPSSGSDEESDGIDEDDDGEEGQEDENGSDSEGWGSPRPALPFPRSLLPTGSRLGLEGGGGRWDFDLEYQCITYFTEYWCMT